MVKPLQNLLRNWWTDFNETWHEVSMTQLLNVYINHDPVMTLTYFTTRTKQLTKCHEPLQKLKVRLGSCKTGLSPPVILYYFKGDTFVVVLIALCLGVYFFVLLAPYVCYHILVKLR